MARHTTLRIGGPADAYFEPADAADAATVVSAAHARGIAITSVGAGTNLLVRDGGIRGLTLCTKALRGIERVGKTRIRVESGCSTGRLLKEALDAELGGLEFLGGVPGSVGGGLIMNAGTNIGEFKDTTVLVRSLRLDGTIVERDHAACGFRYRASDLPRDEVILEGVVELVPRPRTEMDVVIRALRDRRHEREPKGAPNAGSTFKNPPGDFAGRLIEACGLKGARVGGIEVSLKHANWFLNADRGTATDFLTLAGRVRGEVAAKFDILLDMEVRILGEDPVSLEDT